MENSALILLDIQKDFVGEQARMPVARHQVEPMLNTMNTMITQANQAKIPIVYIGNEFEKRQFIANWFRKQAALKNSAGAELDERLQVVSEHYFAKNKGDALSNPGLVRFLKSRGVRHLIISGLFAEGCVAATALGGKRYRYKVTIIRDAVAGATDKKRDLSLEKLATKGVSVINSTELF